jgi:site-specific DNA recombinase
MQLQKNDNKEQKRVAIYIRVSTQEQKMDGYGLEAQESKLIEYVNNNKYQNFITKKEWIFKDVHTGSELNRQGLNKVMSLVKERKIDVVLVWKIDRLSRNLKHLLMTFDEFERNNVSFVSVQENLNFTGPIGKLIFQIFGALAQFERELIKGRTIMGRIASAEMGNFTGVYVPYGYRAIKNPSGRGKKLERIQKEKEMVIKIFNWYIYDSLGLGEITKKLNDLKIPVGECSWSKRGIWTERVVRTMIHNPIYRGKFIANKKDENGGVLPENEWTIVNIPPCISEFVFQQAQEVCKRRKGANSNMKYLLSGKVVDISVDPPKKFVGVKRTKGGFSYRRKQFIRDDEYYGVFEVPGKQIEDYVWGKIIEALREPEIFIEKYLEKEYINETHTEHLEEELASFRRQKVDKELEVARVEEGYEKGVYDEKKTSEKIATKNQEISEIEEKIISLEDQLRFTGAVDLEVKKLKEASAQVKCRLKSLSREQQKVLVNLFVERVEIYKEKVQGKNKITLQIFYKFNPQKFPTRIVKGCAEEELESKENNKNDSGKVNSGATYRSRTDDLLFTRQLLYQLS